MRTTMVMAVMVDAGPVRRWWAGPGVGMRTEGSSIGDPVNGGCLLPSRAEHRHRDGVPVHSQPRKVRPPAAIPDTGRLLRCVAPSTPAWMTHAIPRTGPAVPMLTDQPFHAVTAAARRPGGARL